MKIIRVCNPCEGVIAVTQIEVDHSLESMQRLVGGFIECIQLQDGIDLWCNEEGQLLDLPLIQDLVSGRVIAGDYFFARHDSEGNTISLTDEDCALILSKF